MTKKVKVEFFIEFSGFTLKLFIYRNGIKRYEIDLFKDGKSTFSQESYENIVLGRIQWTSIMNKECLVSLGEKPIFEVSDFHKELEFYCKGLCRVAEFIEAYITYLEENSSGE